jgi:transketolase
MKESYPDEVAKYDVALSGQLDDIIESVNVTFPEGYKDATRNTSLQILEKLHEAIPNLIGGSADVAKSVMTGVKGAVDCMPHTPHGRNINFGIREFAMASIQNGMLLHGGLKTYVGSFLIFSDYMKAAVRLSALSHIPSIYLFSHDSVALGEDGPTHQPIDQLAMLRSIPNMNVIRPADANETWGAFKVALTSVKTPTAIILSRQNLPLLEHTDADKVRKGAYIVSDSTTKEPDMILLATGSEVSLAISVKSKLSEQGYDIRVVSMPSWLMFEEQTSAYQKKILGKERNKVLSIEALTTMGWSKYAAHNIGIDTFGISGPGGETMKHFGFTTESVVETLSILKGQ